MFKKFLVGAALYSMFYAAFAHSPAVGGPSSVPGVRVPARWWNEAPPIPGSVWVGTLGGDGTDERNRLELQLKQDGTAIKIDRHGATRGRWSVQDGQVTMTFNSYVYVGKIDGRTLNGVCQLNGGPLPNAWEFRTRYESLIAGKRFANEQRFGKFERGTEFVFSQDCRAMTAIPRPGDIASYVHGTYSTNVDEVTMHVDGCVFTGRLVEENGIRRLRGTVTSAQDATPQPLSFEVR